MVRPCVTGTREGNHMYEKTLQQIEDECCVSGEDLFEVCVRESAGALV